MLYDTSASVVIIGGGAAGLAAAIAAGRQLAGTEEKILILERMDRIGKKILATGNGRCNLANMKMTPQNYHGDVSFAEAVFDKFGVENTLTFFSSLGLLMVPDEAGRVYPFSGQASSVLDVLRFELERLNIVVQTACEALSIEKTADGFKIRTSGGAVTAKKIILTAGGLAAPELGSNGTGFTLLEKLSHKIASPFPALVQLKTRSEYPRQLKGIRCAGELSISVRGEVRGRERGEIMFTDFGLSGIPTMQLSRIASQTLNSSDAADITAYIDFMPGYDKSDIYRALTEKVKKYPEMPVENLFVGIFCKRIGQVVCKQAGVTPLSRKLCTLTVTEIESLINTVKKFPLPVVGTKGFSSAQVTAGGASASQFNEETMESLLVSGLYAAGEVLNIDGDCGGYNLLWAWASGRLAGESAARALCGEVCDA